MQTITKIQAIDGKLFDDEADCIKYENMIEEIETTMSTLKPIPNDFEFQNGDGFVQQEISIVSKAMVCIADIAGVEKRPEFINDPFACRFGVIGRIIDDSDIPVLYKAWNRFMNIDRFGREWGQSYFARNPEKGKQRDRAAEHDL